MRLRRRIARAVGLGARFRPPRPSPYAIGPDIRLDLSPERWTVEGATKFEADERDIAVVTSFVDIGRSDWMSASKRRPSDYRRTRDTYFEWFGKLARLRNPMVVYCEQQDAAEILDIRRRSGLEHLTTILHVPAFFSLPGPQRLRLEYGLRMTGAFRDWVTRPNCPEYNEPKYDALMAYKAPMVADAVARGLVPGRHVAWVDFGYCRDDLRFDPDRPWRYDFGERLTLFNLAPLDTPVPLLEMARTGPVVFQGCCVVGPPGRWAAFASAIERAAIELLRCNIVDDDQTLFYMAWREDPQAFSSQFVDPSDWFVALRDFNDPR